jgi:hypothetical protein
MDLMEAIGQLEMNDELHEARILILLRSFVGDEGTETIEGLTKLAKLDFLLRYPTMLKRALEKRGKSTRAVQLKEHEEANVESMMVRYRFGPWDHRYRRFLNLLVAKGLSELVLEGRTVKIGLTKKGLTYADKLAEHEDFEEVARRARSLKAHFDLKGTHLMKFIYESFPEILSLSPNEVIRL